MRYRQELKNVKIAARLHSRNIAYVDSKNKRVTSNNSDTETVSKSFWSDIPVVLYRIRKCKSNTIKHNSVNDFITVYSCTVSFNDMFRL